MLELYISDPNVVHEYVWVTYHLMLDGFEAQKFILANVDVPQNLDRIITYGDSLEAEVLDLIMKQIYAITLYSKHYNELGRNQADLMVKSEFEKLCKMHYKYLKNTCNLIDPDLKFYCI